MSGADLAKGSGEVFLVRHLGRKEESGESKVSILGIYDEPNSSDSNKKQGM